MKNRILNATLLIGLLSMYFVSCTSEKSDSTDKEVSVDEQKEEKVNDTEETIVFSANKFFTDKGCVACHQANTKTTGPALTEITQGYNGDREAITKFLYGEADAIIDPSKAPLMAPQVKMTENLSEEEMSALVDFIFSHKPE